MTDEIVEMEEDDELEEEADAEVDKVLFDLTNGKLGQAGKVGTELPVSCISHFMILILTSCPGDRGQANGIGRGNGKDHGEVPAATKWPSQLDWLHGIYCTTSNSI